MSFSRIEPRDLKVFQELLSPDRVLYDAEQLLDFGSDETEDFCFPPEVALFPETTGEVSAIMKHCHARNIPVTTRGAGTGLSGGALPVFGGVCLSMK